MKNIKKRLIGWTLGLALSLGVGIGIASNTHSEIAGVEAASTTYTHPFATKQIPDSLPADVKLSNIEWNVTGTNVGAYNSSNYAGVQFGTSKKNGSLSFKSKLAWGKDATVANYFGKTKVERVKVWLNAGSGIPTANVTIGNIAATSDGTVVKKNSSAKSYTDTTCVTFTPTNGADSGIIEISASTESKAGYFSAIEVIATEGVQKNMTSIEITTPPKKTEYYAGDKFDPTGLVVTKTFDDGSNENLSYAGKGDPNFKFNPDLDTELQETNAFVEINVGEKTVNQSIKVKPARILENITITSGLESVKKTYGEGSSFDPSGLVVTATYNDGSTEDVSSSVVWTPSTLSLTTTSVTGTYKGFTVTVNGIVVSFKNTFNIESNGKYTISHTKNGTVYYLKSNGEESAPTATTVAADATVFNFVLVGGDTFEIKTATGDYLYSENVNDGLRVGQTKDSWLISNGTKTTGSYDFKDINSKRFLSLYSVKDFRCYTSSTANNRTENTDLNKSTLPFFKITGIPEGSIKIGDTGTLGIDDKSLDVSWTTSDKSVVDIAGGVYSAEAGGVATITATHESGAKATAEIVVDFNTIKISEANTLAAGLANKETSKYKVTIEKAFVTKITDNATIVVSDNKVGSESLNSITLYDRTSLEDLSKNAILNGEVTVTGNLMNYNGTYEIVNPVFTYIDDAIDYADMFYGTFTVATGTGAAICEDPNKDNSAKIIEQWNELAESYGLLDEYASAKLKGATSSDSNPTIANMVALYDHIVKRYSATHTEINDFIGRGVTTSLTNQLFKANTTNNIMVISLIACASAAAIGSFFFIRKRKEQN